MHGMQHHTTTGNTVAGKALYELKPESGQGLLCPQTAEALQQLFAQDPDNLVRERAAKCMTVIGRKATGVRKILVCGALLTLLDLLQDAELAVR